MSNEYVVEVEKVSKKIGHDVILKDISFNVEKGQVVGVIGANGSGKTTLLRLIAGLIYPTEGVVKVNGKRVHPGMLGDMPEGVGALIETPSFLPNVSGFLNLLYLSKIRAEITKQDIIQIMQEVGLDPKSTKKVSKYSLGMRQRLGIAQAIMEKQSLVLFDEPTNALDTNGAEIFEEIIKKRKAEGISFIFVSHDMAEIERFCDKVYKIKNQSLVLQENEIEWAVMLEDIEDIEKVLIARPNAKMGERINGKPVMLIPFASSNQEEIESYLKELSIKYKFVRD